MMVYPLVYRLVAETPQEKSRVYRLINNIMNYIVDNGFVLIDADGQITQWGRWAYVFNLKLLLSFFCLDSFPLF